MSKILGEWRSRKDRSDDFSSSGHRANDRCLQGLRDNGRGEPGCDFGAQCGSDDARREDQTQGPTRSTRIMETSGGTSDQSGGSRRLEGFSPRGPRPQRPPMLEVGQPLKSDTLAGHTHQRWWLLTAACACSLAAAKSLHQVQSSVIATIALISHCIIKSVISHCIHQAIATTKS